MNDEVSALRIWRDEHALELGRIDKAIAILSDGSSGANRKGKATPHTSGSGGHVHLRKDELPPGRLIVQASRGEDDSCFLGSMWSRQWMA